MKVSCICPTFNRAPNHLHLLRDAVRCFQAQVLPIGVEAELLILNDAPGQELTCAAAGVRVCNEPFRFKTLGDKYTAMVELSDGDLILPWEDDDLSLPLRIAQAIQAGRPYFNPGWTWYEERGKPPRRAGGVCHNASAFTAEAFYAVGGSYAPLCGGQDADMDRRLREQFGCNEPVAESHYIYRWGVQPYHLSGVADYSASDPHEGHYRRIGEKPIEAGVFDLTPPF